MLRYVKNICLTKDFGETTQMMTMPSDVFERYTADVTGKVVINVNKSSPETFITGTFYNCNGEIITWEPVGASMWINSYSESGLEAGVEYIAYFTARYDSVSRKHRLYFNFTTSEDTAKDYPFICRVVANENGGIPTESIVPEVANIEIIV